MQRFLRKIGHSSPFSCDILLLLLPHSYVSVQFKEHLPDMIYWKIYLGKILDSFSFSLSLLSFHLYHTNIELYQGCQENFLDSVQRETIAAAAEGDWDRDRVWGIGRMS